MCIADGGAKGSHLDREPSKPKDQDTSFCKLVLHFYSPYAKLAVIHLRLPICEIRSHVPSHVGVLTQV